MRAGAREEQAKSMTLPWESRLFAPQDDMPRTASYTPEVVSWNTTQRCNLQCSHCYLAAGLGSPTELSFEEGCQVIDQLAAAGTQMLILTGGEPLMRRDIVGLVRRASEKGITAVLGTNGMPQDSRTVRQLREAGLAGAGISLDSVEPSKHDGFRGVPGAWEGAVRGIRLCRKEGLPVLLQMTALPWNYTQIPQMVAFAHQEGLAGFTLYFLVCTGRGEQLSDISPGQYEEALHFLIQAQEASPDMMVRARCAPQIGRLASEAGSALVGNAGCPAARQYCRITPEGSVTPCPYCLSPVENCGRTPSKLFGMERPCSALSERASLAGNAENAASKSCVGDAGRGRMPWEGMCAVRTRGVRINQGGLLRSTSSSP